MSSPQAVVARAGPALAGLPPLLVRKGRGLPAALRHELRAIEGLRSDRPRAAYIGFVGYGNLGDEALLEAHRRLFPDVDLVVYRKSRALALRHRATGRSPYDFGILGGGTLIAQHHSWLESVRQLQSQGVPMICVGTGVAAPAFWRRGGLDRSYLLHEPGELAAWREALERFVYVGVRGPESARELAAWGIADADVVGDAVLSLATAPAPVVGQARERLVGVNVGCTPGDPMWGDPDTFLAEMTRFVARLCDAGRRVRLLPIREGDVASAELVRAGVGSARCEIVRAFDGYASYAAQARDCEVFVGQKLHATVIACLQRVPALMIEYRPKCRDFMASLGLEDLTVRTDAFTAEVGVTMLDDLLGRRDLVAARLDEHIARYRRRQVAAATVLTRHLLTGGAAAAAPAGPAAAAPEPVAAGDVGRQGAGR